MRFVPIIVCLGALAALVFMWGNLGGAVLNALLSIIAHDRLDSDLTLDDDQVAAANEILEGDEEPPG